MKRTLAFPLTILMVTALCGRVKDTFYYITNSQWGAINDKGELAPAEKLRDPVILKVKL